MMMTKCLSFGCVDFLGCPVLLNNFSKLFHTGGILLQVYSGTVFFLKFSCCYEALKLLLVIVVFHAEIVIKFYFLLLVSKRYTLVSSHISLNRFPKVNYQVKCSNHLKHLREMS